MTSPGAWRPKRISSFRQYNEHVGGLAEYPNIAAWHVRIAERPAVKRGMTVWMPESDGGWSAAGNAAQIAAGT
jgi:glutathione S-transferase